VNNLNKYIAEFLGTYMLVFVGTAAIVVNDLYGGVVTHVGVSMVFGMIVTAMIYTFGDVSGAHINPAVTLGFWRAGRLAGKEVAPYILAQLGGGLFASLCVYFLFSQHETLGATLPAGSVLQSFVLEVIMTFILMLAILSVSTGAKEKGLMAGVAIGAVVGLEALFGGPVTGASMNPARSLAPAIISGHLEHLWVYILAPVTGATLATFCCRFIRTEEGCCS
jgi:aquaporin NIP